MLGQIVGCFRDPGPDDEPEPGIVEGLQVGRGQHAGIGDHNHVSDLVTVLERFDDRDDRGSLGLVTLIAGDL